MKSIVAARLGCGVLLAAVPLAALPEAAAARSCSLNGSGTTYNRSGDRAQFRALQALGGMNCPSARYVLNKFIRRSFHEGDDDSIITRFHDGYVDWECDKLRRTRWECVEYVSSTSFRFTAYLDY